MFDIIHNFLLYSIPLGSAAWFSDFTLVSGDAWLVPVLGAVLDEFGVDSAVSVCLHLFTTRLR